MNVEKKQKDNLTMEVAFTIDPADYQPGENKFLAEKKRTTELKGFRRGMAPLSLIKRLYGTQAFYESVNDVLQKGIDDFIKESGLDFIGEPMQTEDTKNRDWVSGEPIEVAFEIGYTEPVVIEPSKSDKVPSYEIGITDEAKAEMKKNMLLQLGQMQEVESATDQDTVYADLRNEGHSVENASIFVGTVEGQAKDKFVGAKAGDKFSVNVNEAFPNETDRASMLRVSKDALENIDPNFDVEIVNVKSFVPAEESQEVYDQLFGKDNVKSSEEFDAAIEKRLRDNYDGESRNKLYSDLKEYLIEKAGIALPDEFLKRWLEKINEGKFTSEQVAEQYPDFAKEYRWDMIGSALAKKYNVQVSKDDLYNAALDYARYQYAMYGLSSIPQNVIQDAAERMLSDESQARSIRNSVRDTKILDKVKEEVTLSKKKVTVEKFRDLLREGK